MKLQPHSIDGELAGYTHWCPACNELHAIAVGKPNRSGAVWTFNGDLESPTFTPSVRCFTIDDDGKRETLCHYFITNGQIVYCSDNPHALNGQTVELPDRE